MWMFGYVCVCVCVCVVVVGGGGGGGSGGGGGGGVYWRRVCVRVRDPMSVRVCARVCVCRKAHVHVTMIWMNNCLFMYFYAVDISVFPKALQLLMLLLWLSFCFLLFISSVFIII